MESKELMIFLLEGETDIPYIEKLYNQFEQLKRKFVPIFIHTDGDITSRTMDCPKKKIKKAEKDKLRQATWKYIDDWLRGDTDHASQSGIDFEKRDIAVIVQIIDMDGRFIPEECVVQDTAYGMQPIYTETCIKHAAATKFFNEMGARKNLLNSLLEQSFRGQLNKKDTEKKAYTLCGIQHRVYYTSCNVEHVFWGKEEMCAKLVKGRKNERATAFLKSNASEILHATLMNPDVTYPYDESQSLMENYEKSWEYVKSGTNSLKRMTNLNLLFVEYGGVKAQIQGGLSA